MRYRHERDFHMSDFGEFGVFNGATAIQVSVHESLQTFAAAVSAAWPANALTNSVDTGPSVIAVPAGDPAFDAAWSRSFTEAHVDGSAIIRLRPGGSADARALYSLSGEITKLVINAHIGQKFLFHAAGAALGGAAVGLVAESGTGKSTAVRHLVEHLGCGYLTDETLIVDPDTHRVTPYQKPVSQRAANGEKTDLPIVTEEFHELPTLTRLVLLDRRPEAAGVTVTALSPGEAMSALVEQSSSIWKVPAPALRLARLVTSIPVERVTYAEAAETAAHLLPIAASAGVPPSGPALSAPPTGPPTRRPRRVTSCSRSSRSTSSSTSPAGRNR